MIDSYCYAKSSEAVFVAGYICFKILHSNQWMVKLFLLKITVLIFARFLRNINGFVHDAFKIILIDFIFQPLQTVDLNKYAEIRMVDNRKSEICKFSGSNTNSSWKLNKLKAYQSFRLWTALAQEIKTIAI